MPVDMTVEKPGARIVSNESQGGRVHRQHLDCVTSDWIHLSLLQGRIDSRVIRSVVVSAVDDLELVAVKMATWQKFSVTA